MFHRLTLVVAFAAALVFLVVEPASAAAPHRIISLSPTATESLFAIGAGKQVVAVDDQSDYPKRAPRTSLSGYTPNVEAIAGYHPDLVVLSGNPNDVVSGLPAAFILLPFLCIHADGPDIWAQVVYGRDREWAATVDDVLRGRTTVALRGLDGERVSAALR